MRILFKPQAANFTIVANRYLQKTKTAGTALVAAEIASNLLSLCHVPPVFEAIGSIVLLARAVHKRRREPQEVQELVAWREWFQAQNLDMEGDAASDRQESNPKRSLFPLFFAGLMAINATTSCINEDMEIIPKWVVTTPLEKYVDFLERNKMGDSEGIARLKKELEKMKSSKEI